MRHLKTAGESGGEVSMLKGITCLLGCFTLTLALNLPCLSQQRPPQHSPTAEQVLISFVQAVGGVTAHDSIKSSFSEGSIVDWDRDRKMEETQGKKWVATFHTRSDKPFVRKASSGGWRTVLPEKTVAYMEAHWGPIMKRESQAERVSRTNSQQGVARVSWQRPTAPRDCYFSCERTEPSSCNRQYSVEERQACDKHEHIGNVQAGLGRKPKPGPRTRK
jgi:hypothetical protein